MIWLVLGCGPAVTVEGLDSGSLDPIGWWMAPTTEAYSHFLLMEEPMSCEALQDSWDGARYVELQRAIDEATSPEDECAARRALYAAYAESPWASTRTLIDIQVWGPNAAQILPSSSTYAAATEETDSIGHHTYLSREPRNRWAEVAAAFQCDDPPSAVTDAIARENHSYQVSGPITFEVGFDRVDAVLDLAVVSDDDRFEDGRIEGRARFERCSLP
ncbi:MAG: hypothetical protein R3F61_34005 [Myxococcota bacterium]